MNKLKAFVTMIAMLMVPTFSGADVESIVGDNCLIPVYHTNFIFPPEGGTIIKAGDNMYFVQDYRPECANAASKAQVIKISGSTVTSANTSTNIVGDNCLVPIYHTDFLFPPEGGQIVKIGNSLYFHQNYRPECARAVVGAEVVRTFSGATITAPSGGVAAGNTGSTSCTPKP